MKESWFKVAVVIIGVIGVGVLYYYPQEKLAADKELEAFRVCMSTIREEVLRDAGALKANLAICKETSQNF